MADRKKNRRKVDEDEKPTKEEYAVAKFLRFNVPTKEAKLHNMEVHCFFASAAIDALLESKWSAAKNAKEPLFSNRNSCVFYCQRLMEKGLFHRAERVQRKKDKDKGDKSKKKKSKETADKDEGGTGDELRERKNKKDKKGKKEKNEEEPEKASVGVNEDQEKCEEKREDKKDDKKKKKEKPVKLLMTDDQRFLDGEDNVYVWIYDPVHAKTLFIGSLIVLGAIALCLFPLWPEIVRVGVYYISLVAATFVGFILSLVVIRFILFCGVWLVTLGRHHFWLLPNLTEDVGFFESFRPLYLHDTPSEKHTASGKGKKKSSSSTDKKSKQKSEKKSSDKESESEQEEFEMINRGEVGLVAEDGEEKGEEESEENGEVGEQEEEEEYGAGEEDEDYDDEDEDGLNGVLEDGYEEEEEGEEEDEEEEEDELESKKDK